MSNTTILSTFPVAARLEHLGAPPALLAEVSALSTDAALMWLLFGVRERAWLAVRVGVPRPLVVAAVTAVQREIVPGRVHGPLLRKALRYCEAWARAGMLRRARANALFGALQLLRESDLSERIAGLLAIVLREHHDEHEIARPRGPLTTTAIDYWDVLEDHPVFGQHVFDRLLPWSIVEEAWRHATVER